MRLGFICLVLLAAVLISSGLADHLIKPHPKILWNVKVYPTPPDRETVGVPAVEFSPDGEQIIAAGWDGSIKFLNRSNGIAARTILAHTGAVHSVSISKDGLLLASGGADGMLNLWRVSDGTLLQSIINAHTTAVHSVALSPDASLMISGGGLDNQLKIWRTVDGELVRSIYGGSFETAIDDDRHRGMRSVAFAPNGQYVAGSGLEVWRLDGTVVRASESFTLEAEARSHVTFTPDSARVFGSVLYGIWVRGIADETAFYADWTSTQFPSSAMSPDGRSLFSVGGYGVEAIWGPGVMSQRDAGSRQNGSPIWYDRCVESSDCLFGFLSSWLTSDLAFDPRMQTLAAGTTWGEVWLFELPTWISGVQRNGNQLNLQWQGGSGNYQVQKLTPPGTWLDVGGPVTDNAASVNIDASMALLRVRNIAP